jgi:hypothetical protein
MDRIETELEIVKLFFAKAVAELIERTVDYVEIQAELESALEDVEELRAECDDLYLENRDLKDELNIK